jgi:hypothetical protein
LGIANEKKSWSMFCKVNRALYKTTIKTSISSRCFGAGCTWFATGFMLVSSQSCPGRRVLPFSHKRPPMHGNKADLHWMFLKTWISP